MENIQSLRDKRQEKTSQALKDNKVFFAFSDKQFEENKTPLEEGDKYVSLGMGGYCPKKNVDEFFEDMKGINQWFKDSVKDNNLREELIAFELSNHEAYYTGEIEDTMEALGSEFTEEEVWEVFRKNSKLMQSW